MILLRRLFFILTFLLSLNLYSQEILRISGKKAVISTGNFNFEVGKRYYVLLKKVVSSSSGKKKKVAVIEVRKILNNKALILILKGKMSSDYMIKKTKLYSKAGRKKKMARNKKVEHVDSDDSDESEDMPKAKKTMMKNKSVLFGPLYFLPDALVENGEDIGYEFAAMIGVDASFRYHFNSTWQLRTTFNYAKGTATFPTLNDEEFDISYSSIAAGPAFYFYKKYFLFAEYGISTLGISGNLTISGATTNFTTNYKGKVLRGGVGYHYKINDGFSISFEAAVHKISWSSAESDSSSSQGDTSIDYSQTAASLAGLLSYQW